MLTSTMHHTTRLLRTLSIIVICFISGVGCPNDSNSKALLTVFVHGSIFSATAALSPKKVLADALSDNSYYVQAIKKIRHNPLLRRDQLLLDVGLHPIERTTIEQFNHPEGFDEATKKSAAFGLVSVYNTIATHAQQNNTTDRLYYAFGHYGLLSQQYRQQAAHQLYDELTSVIKKMRSRYQEVTVNIVAHSHGGNIALNLAKATQNSSNPLFINALYLFGTPLHQETASYAYDTMFGKVFNVTSDGDYVQGADWISTAQRKAYKRFADIPNIKKDVGAVFDVRISVDNNSKRIDHANMWCIGRSIESHQALGKLPFMTLLPMYIPLFDQLTAKKEVMNSLEASLLTKPDNQLVYLVKDATGQHVYSTSGSAQLITTCAESMMRNWLPADNQTSPVFNGKSVRVLYDAFYKNTVHTQR